ncbi:MAG: Maf family protein [Verrucomicrobiota bacterium]|nr:Maf family protein [Verrucomicrobiota bacterium]
MSAGGRRLLLASASPRRRQLLASAGYDFDVAVPSVTELHADTLTLRELTCCNALRKGLAVARAYPGRIVLAADTLVALDRQVIGKPAHLADAARLLRLLSGRTHLVASGVFISDLRQGKSMAFTVLSRVVFKKLSDRTIEKYLATIDPLDKAGGYAAQGSGRMIIAKIVGSRSNVIGLPMEKTSAALRRFQIRPRA